MLKKISKIVITCLMIVLFIGMRQNCTYALMASSEPTYEGIDVSHYQGVIDYEKVKKEGIQIVYIKSSEGSHIVDSQFKNNYNNAKKNGLKVGFYHYVIARNTEEAIQEAEFFHSVIKGTIPDCRLAMDFESFGELTNEQINQIAVAFLERLQKLTGKEVVVYSNAYSARTKFSVELAQKYPLWIAEYGVKEPSSNVNWDSWIGFQYTDTGQIYGINGYVDRDKFTKEIFLDETGIIPEPENPQPPQNNEIIYIVKRGDTLSQIAQDYGVTIQSIVDNNNIQNPNLIFVGQKLVIKGGKNDENSQENVVYRVKRGDTLSQIAQNYGVSVQQLVRWNGIQNPNLIFVGQRLIINRTQQETNECGHIIYRVRRGDNLYRIARRFGVTIQSIVRLNNIRNPHWIYVGQLLRIGRCR